MPDEGYPVVVLFIDDEDLAHLHVSDSEDPDLWEHIGDPEDDARIEWDDEDGLVKRVAEAVLKYGAQNVSYGSAGRPLPALQRMLDKYKNYDPAWLRVWAQHIVAGGDSDAHVSVFPDNP